jgi:endonuclease/exonuclease/phosphatase (EEP) superfamily protein YafD
VALGSRDWRGLLLGLLEASLLVTVAFSVATAFDDWHRLLELFSHFRLQYLVIAVLLTPVFMALRWKGYVVIGIATIALNAWYVVPWYLPVEAAGEGGGPGITLLHANVLKSNDEPERFIALVEELEPDLVVMQEVRPAWLASLGALERSFPYRVSEAREDAFGIALFSRFPLEATAVVEPDHGGTPQIITTARIEGRPLHIVATHPLPPIGAEYYSSRNEQLRNAARLLQRLPAPKLLVGDLNVTMWSNHYRALEAESGLRNARRGFGVAPTWPVFFPLGFIPIDHLLVSDGIEVLAFSTGPRIGSDHLPVVARIRLDTE